MSMSLGIGLGITRLNTPVAAPPLFDVVSGAAWGVSLRKLRKDYSGNCLRVRRAGDNAEQDIGFDAAGVIDTSALLAFVNASGNDDGHVVTWYDQGPDGYDVTNATTSQQPLIVDNGSVLSDSSSNPVIKFDSASSTSFETSATPANIGGGTNDSFIHAVVTIDTSLAQVQDGALVYYGRTIGTSARSLCIDGGGTRQIGVDPYVNQQNFNTAYPANDVCHALVHWDGGTQILGYLNGEATDPTAITTAFDTSSMLYIRVAKSGSSSGQASYLANELAIFDADITANISDVYANVQNRFKL